MTPKSLRFWPILLTVVLADCASKRVIEARLVPDAAPKPVAGEVLRVRLSYNQNAAFGIDMRGQGRWLLTLIAGCAVAGLIVAYRRTHPANVMLITGLALVAGGALGNLLDRIRSARGVVDFIDIGIGDTRFWIFNLADLAISAGAVLLAFAVWRQAQVDRPAPSDAS